MDSSIPSVIKNLTLIQFVLVKSALSFGLNVVDLGHLFL